MTRAGLADSPGPGLLEVDVHYAWPEVVLAVAGEIDLLTAPDLTSQLDAVIDRGYRSVVLDAAQIGFMGAGGLRCIASAAARLELSGGYLSILSPSDLLIRVLVVTGLDRVVRLGPRRPSLAPERAGSAQAVKDIPAELHLPAEQAAESPTITASEGSPSLPPALGHALRAALAVSAAEDVVDGALRLVVALARETVEGADGVSVSLRRHGRLSTVAASDQTILEMDADQYGSGEGPCVDASVEGRWFHVESLDQETRWPAFTPLALKLGINAILSSPLVAAGRPVGALNIYSRTAGSFDTKGQVLASVFAREASVILADAGVNVTPDEFGHQLADALRSREVISQAQGILMERKGLSSHDAYSALRHSSQASNTPLYDEAMAVVASAHPAPAGAAEQPGGESHG